MPLQPPNRTASISEPALVRWALILSTVGILAVLLLLPLVLVFAEALHKGLKLYAAALTDPVAWSAIKLTTLVCVLSVIANTVFGVAVAWAVTKFNFRGKSLLLTLIDIPFAISPVIGGLIFVLLFGANGWWGPWLLEHNLQVIFATPGVILATLFITFPFVARELIPVMQSQGIEEEEAAFMLGADGWHTFWRVTLPNIKWGLLYGIVLCSARAMGEFGAVSVVSGNIRGRTTTLPQHIENLYLEANFTAAFTCASLMSLLALATLGIKAVVEWRSRISASHVEVLQ